MFSGLSCSGRPSRSRMAWSFRGWSTCLRMFGCGRHTDTIFQSFRCWHTLTEDHCRATRRHLADSTVPIEAWRAINACAGRGYQLFQVVMLPLRSVCKLCSAFLQHPRFMSFECSSSSCAGIGALGSTSASCVLCAGARRGLTSQSLSRIVRQLKLDQKRGFQSRPRQLVHAVLNLITTVTSVMLARCFGPGFCLKEY